MKKFIGAVAVFALTLSLSIATAQEHPKQCAGEKKMSCCVEKTSAKMSCCVEKTGEKMSNCVEKTGASMSGCTGDAKAMKAAHKEECMKDEKCAEKCKMAAKSTGTQTPNTN